MRRASSGDSNRETRRPCDRAILAEMVASRMEAILREFTAQNLASTTLAFARGKVKQESLTRQELLTYLEIVTLTSVCL